MNKLTKIILITTLLIAGFFVRSYKINNPVADWHSFRQADTASVTRIYLENGIDILHPKYHDLSDTQSGKDNPNGYRFVEFPFYNIFSLAVNSVLAPAKQSLEVSSRLTSILFSLGSTFLIFLITKKITKNYYAALISMSVFLFLPFNVYYSRTILPEPTAVFFMLLCLFLFFDHPIVASVPMAISILTKPYSALIIFPSLAVVAFSKFKKDTFLRWFTTYLFFGITAMAPFIAWRVWMSQFPEGIPVNQWLLAKNINYSGLDWFHGLKVSNLLSFIAFKPYWFRWLFYERISNLILGSFGLVPLFLGFIYKKNLTQKITSSLALGILLFFVVVAGGNIQHDYYQALIIPSLSIISGIGYYYLIHFTFGNKAVSCVVAGIVASFSIAFSWFVIKPYYLINNPSIITAGQKINSIIPSNALVVAPYNGDTAFLYQTHHSGWPTEVYNFEAIKKQHPNTPFFFVSVNYDQYTHSVMDKFETIFKNDQYIIINLNSPRTNGT